MSENLTELSESELQALTLVGARDLIVECFYRAQKETFARAAKAMGSAPSDADLRQTVEGAVRLTFRTVKADYDQPTRQGLIDTVTSLAGKAAAMGTPPDIIEHHRKQLGRVFAALGE